MSTPSIPVTRLGSQATAFTSASPAAETPGLIVGTGFEGRSPAPSNDEIEELVRPLTKHTLSDDVPSSVTLAKVRHNKSEEERLRKELHLMESAHGKNSVQILHVLRGLFTVLKSQSRYNAAEEIGRRRVLTYRQFYPEDDGYAQAIADLAFLFVVQGQYNRAERLAKKACALRLSTTGEDDTTIWCKTVLLQILYQTRQLQEAEQLSASLLSLGSMTMSRFEYTIISGEMANALTAQGRLKEAHDWSIRAYQSSLQTFGANEINTIASMGIIVYNLELQAKLDEAEKMGLEFLSLCREQFGPEHCHTASAYHSLGRVYKSQGRWDEAEALIQAAIIANTNVFGPNHENTFFCLRSKVEIYIEQQRWDDAARSMAECQILLPNLQVKPFVRISINEAEIWDGQGKYEQAGNIGSEAARLVETTMPLYAPSSFNVMATILRNLGDIPASEKFGSKAVEKSRMIYGSNHPQTARCLDNLARTWMVKGESEKAIQTMKECADSLASVVGPEHYLTIRSNSILREWTEWQNMFDVIPLLPSDWCLPF